MEIQIFLYPEAMLVHQFIKLEPSFTQQLKSSILIFEEMAELVKLFDDGDLRLVDGKFYWAQNKV